MSKPVAENTSISPPRATQCESPMLGQLQYRASDAPREVNADDATPSHQAIKISPAAPFLLSFTHLTYTVTRRGPGSKTKTILDDISGSARDGEITAIMGASGSGKSTLLDALANRIARGSLRGSATLNGEPVGSRLTKAISAYVMQDDVLFPMLTVEETLMFAAEFRLPRALPRSQKKARVRALIDQLGLRDAANTIVGDEGRRGVSGGERRRVSIGADIIHDPILLFLDEPTSGLDSTSAYLVVRVLRRIAASGSVVIMSIHQPSYRILGLVDLMIFLSRGKAVYGGPPSDLPRFFAELGHPVTEGENRMEFAMDVIRDLEVSPGGIESMVEFNKSWQQALNVDVENLSLKESISASISTGKLVLGTNLAAISPVPSFANPPWIEVAVLSRRSFTNSLRMPELFAVRVACVVVTGFILATMFWRLDNSPKGVQERTGFFAFAMSTIFYTCVDILPVFLHERYIFMRETAHNSYRRSSYLLSHALTSLPTLIFMSLIFSAGTFWAVGLDGSFLFYFLVVFSAYWAGSGFVAFISGVLPHVMLGYITVVAVLSYFLLFCGFFSHRDRIPAYWIWFHYMSLVKYPYEAVLQNEFRDPTKCFVRGTQVFDGTPLGAVAEEMKVKLLQSMSATLGMEVTSESCVTTGGDILQQQGVTDLSQWDCLWVIVAWGFFYRFLFYLSLLVGSKNKRR